MRRQGKEAEQEDELKTFAPSLVRISSSLNKRKAKGHGGKTVNLRGTLKVSLMEPVDELGWR